MRFPLKKRKNKIKIDMSINAVTALTSRNLACAMPWPLIYLKATIHYVGWGSILTGMLPNAFISWFIVRHCIWFDLQLKSQNYVALCFCQGNSLNLILYFFLTVLLLYIKVMPIENITFRPHTYKHNNLSLGFLSQTIALASYCCGIALATYSHMNWAF